VADTAFSVLMKSMLSAIGSLASSLKMHVDNNCSAGTVYLTTISLSTRCLYEFCEPIENWSTFSFFSSCI